MPQLNRQFCLVHRPQGLIASGDLQLAETPLPALQEGQALARVKYFSMDPTMRIWMADIPQYMPPVALGEVMRCIGLAEVIESRHEDFSKGDKLTALTGLQEFMLIEKNDPRILRKLPHIPFVSDSIFLGLLGINGLTAYFGMMDIAKPQKGATLVVSAAAGATGSVAGQIGKIHGCRAVGIAGTDEKCAWLTNDLGFDAAINYKHPDWKAQFAAATPKGIDINFENVGGEVMLEVLSRMNLFGRVAVCGLISGYPRQDPGMASFALVLMKRLHVQGFIVLDYASRYTEAATQLGKWKMLGKLKDRETIIEGFEKAPEAINMLFTGANIGKLLVKLC